MFLLTVDGASSYATQNAVRLTASSAGSETNVNARGGAAGGERSPLPPRSELEANVMPTNAAVVRSSFVPLLKRKMDVN